MISAQSFSTTRRSSVTLDSGIVTALPTKPWTTQLDLVHVGRTLGYPLTMASSSLTVGRRSFRGDRRGVPSGRTLRAKHRPAEDACGDPSRIARTRAIREDSVATEQLVSKGCRASSAVAAVDCDVRRARCRGFEVPVDLNPVERLMGEVKRCKNQWMRWTAEGLEGDTQLRLVKYADPEYYQASLMNCSNVRPKQQSTVTSQLRVPAAKFQTALQHGDQ